MQEKPAIRCNNCKKMIATGSMKDGEIDIKCKCGVTNTIKVTPSERHQSISLGVFPIQHIST